MNGKCNTIVLIHGLWVTPLSWQPFHKFYGNLGYQVLAPAWPGVEGSISDMRRDPSALRGIGIAELVARYAKVIRGLSESPIIMGHGYGGIITQILIDQGLGAAGVAINSLPPKGILLRSLSTSLTLLPVLANPFNSHGMSRLDFRRFQQVFCNTLPESEARRAYETQVIPAPRRPILQVAFADVTPSAATTLNFKNPHRSPLLFISGGRDMIAPPSLVRKIFRRHCASPCLTDYKEFPGRGHYIIAEQGWQEVADHALTWALAHAHARA